MAPGPISSQLPPDPLSDGTVTARPFRDDDVAAVTEACQDREISRWTSAIPWPYAEEDARAFISGQPGEWAAALGASFAVVDALDGGLLGSVGLHDVNRRRGDAEIGYWVAAWARGRGVATRAVVLVTAWAFSDFGLDYLDLLAKVGNVASEKVAARAGYRLAGPVSGVPGVLDPSQVFDATRWTATADGGPAMPWPNRFSDRT